MKDATLLGRQVKDRITGFEGIITGSATYLTGCDQHCVTGQSQDGKPAESIWFDVNRLDVIGQGVDPLDFAPTVGAKPGGPQSHPAPAK